MRYIHDQREQRRHSRFGDPAECAPQAESILSQVEELTPREGRSSLSLHRFRILLGKGDSAGAVRVARDVSDAQPTKAVLQNELAWGLATCRGLSKEGLAVAESMARRAKEATQDNDADVLDTLARVYFLQGKTPKPSRCNSGRWSCPRPGGACLRRRSTATRRVSFPPRTGWIPDNWRALPPVLSTNPRMDADRSGNRWASLNPGMPPPRKEARVGILGVCGAEPPSGDSWLAKGGSIPRLELGGRYSIILW